MIGARDVRDQVQAWAAEPRHLLGLVLTAPPLLLLAVLGFQRRWMSDDGMIVTRTARNLYAGHGPVFNVGERVETVTSTLWLGIVWLVHVVARGDWGREAVLTGLTLGMLGLILGVRAALRLTPGPGVALPAGIVVLAALPPMWDFLTSGLETGLIFGWLGTSYWLLVRDGVRETPARLRRRLPVALLIGLGPLVRPDLGLVMLAFGYCLVRQGRREGWPPRRTTILTVVALFLPAVLWQIFRMGYYAALVPNTAIAKSAGSSAWDFGTMYFWDLVGRYWLLLPILALAAALWLPAVRTARRAGDASRIRLLIAPVAAGLLHALYIVRVGGDFMHGRMLLPALMCGLLPVLAMRVPLPAAVAPAPGVPTSARRGVPAPGSLALGGLAVVLVWGVVVAVNVRGEAFDPPRNMIADERAYYINVNSGLASTYSRAAMHLNLWYLAGQEVQQLSETGVDEFVDADFGSPSRPSLPGAGVVARRGSIGFFGYAAPDVFIADTFALADPIGARLELPLPEVPRTGHNQQVPIVWHFARFTPREFGDDDELLAARETVRCGEVADFIAAVDEPLTVGRFFSNVVHAFSYTRLSIPGDPVAAKEKFCR